MRKGKRSSSRRRRRVGKGGVKALAAATAVAGGTHAYAEAIRFENNGEFEWSRCHETVRLDVTMPAQAQDGELSPSSFDQFRTCEDCYEGPTIGLVAANGAWVVEDYYYADLLALRSGYVIDERAEWGDDRTITGDCTLYHCGWCFGERGYAGIRFQADDGVHYGWIKSRLIDEDRPYLPALAWGYETEPNTPIQAGAGVAACAGNETLRLKCKPARQDFKIKAVVKKARPGLFVTFRLDDDPNTDQQKVVNRRGKAKAKFTRVSQGNHTVEVRECELRKDATCQP